MYVPGEYIVCVFLYSEFTKCVYKVYDIFGLAHFHGYAAFTYIYIVCIDLFRVPKKCVYNNYLCIYVVCVYILKKSIQHRCVYIVCFYLYI